MKNKGITLIALIVTIIVLLILAGVTIIKKENLKQASEKIVGEEKKKYQIWGINLKSSL